MHCFGLAKTSETKKSHESVSLQRAQSTKNGAQDLVYTQRAGTASRLEADIVVELQQINVGPLQALNARTHGITDDRCGVAYPLRRHTVLGAKSHISAQLFEHATQVLLGAAVAVRRSGVEVCDTKPSAPQRPRAAPPVPRTINRRRCRREANLETVSQTERSVAIGILRFRYYS
jgi:hypothetical protein